MTQINPSLYDEKKASEVAFYFLWNARELGRSITKLRFLKWMYLAEKLSYKNLGEPLTGDVLTSMVHGPVTDTTRRLIENPASVENRTGAWDSVVALEHGGRHIYVTTQESCPYNTPDDLLQLSDAELNLLDQVWEQFGHWNSGQLERYLHSSIQTPEWNWVKGTKSTPIELETMLKSVGFDDTQISDLLDNLKASESIKNAFSKA